MVEVIHASNKEGFDFSKYVQFYFLIEKRVRSLSINCDNYTKSNIVKYLFSHVYVSAILGLQKEIEDNDLRLSISKVDCFFEETFFMIFEKEFSKIFINFIDWYLDNYDRFPIYNIEYQNVNFSPYNLETTCYHNFHLGHDLHYFTISRIVRTYFQRLTCIYFQKQWHLKKLQKLNSFELANISINQFIQEGTSKKLKLLNLDNYINLTISPTQLRDVLLNRWHAYCYFEEISEFIETSINRKRENIHEFDKTPLVYLIIKDSLRFLINFLENLYLDPLSARFNYFENQICYMTNLLGTTTDIYKIRKRLSSGNPSTQQVNAKLFFGISTDMNRGKYEQLVSNFDISKEYKKYFYEFFDHEKLECDPCVINKNLQGFWIGEDNLYMLDLFLLCKITSLKFTNQMSLLKPPRLSKEKTKYLENISYRFNDTYITWVSHASELCEKEKN